MRAFVERITMITKGANPMIAMTSSSRYAQRPLEPPARHVASARRTRDEAQQHRDHDVATMTIT